MQQVTLSAEQSRTFGAAFTIEEIRAYVEEHRAEYEAWLAQEEKKEQYKEIPPLKRSRVSRKGVTK